MTKPHGDIALSWMATALAVCYTAWCIFSLSRRIPAFGRVFDGVRGELPAATTLVMAICTPVFLWPMGGLIVALLVLKELRIESTSTRIGISVVVFMVVALLMALATEAVFEPMLQIMKQVG